MRILTNFKDYYDAALAYGADERIVYNRKSDIYDRPPHDWEFTEIPVHYTSGHNTPTLQLRKFHLNLIPVKVYLAGIEYHGIGVKKVTGQSEFFGTLDEQWFWNIDDYIAYLKEFKIDLKEVKTQNKRKRRYGKREPYWFSHPYYREGAEKWFNVERPDQYRETFIVRKVPIATSHQPNHGWHVNETVEFNGSIGKFHFYRRMDSFQTYQELDMFVAGTMTQEDNPMAGIDDVHLAQAKGFDCYSFKKAPTKRKPKECKK